MSQKSSIYRLLQGPQHMVVQRLVPGKEGPQWLPLVVLRGSDIIVVGAKAKTVATADEEEILTAVKETVEG